MPAVNRTAVIVQRFPTVGKQSCESSIHARTKKLNWLLLLIRFASDPATPDFLIALSSVSNPMVTQLFRMQSLSPQSGEPGTAFVADISSPVKIRGGRQRHNEAVQSPFMFSA
jgi:hypothetical protein